MKKILTLLFCSAFVFACKGLKPENPDIIQLGIVPDDIIISAASGEDGVRIIADRDYSLALLSGSEWLSMGIAGRDTLSFSFSENKGFRRSAIIKVSANGREDALVVKQEGVFHESATLSEHEISMPVEGGHVSIRLSSNMPSDVFSLECSHEEAFHKLSISDYMLSFDVLPTTNRDKRTYTVTVYCTDGWGERVSDTVSIVQDAYN